MSIEGGCPRCGAHSVAAHSTAGKQKVECNLRLTLDAYELRVHNERLLRAEAVLGATSRKPVGVDRTGKFGKIPALNDERNVVSSLTNRSSNGVGAQVNSCE